VPEFSPGLEGVVAAQTAVSEVDGANGRLIYRGGYLIEDLAPAVTYEEVAYLLWHGELPDTAELDAQRKQMAAARALNKAGRGALMATDPATDPMDVLRTAASALSAFDPETEDNSRDANVRKSERLTAVFPALVAAHHRIRQGMEPVAPRADLTHAANFLYMLDVEAFRGTPDPGGTTKPIFVIWGAPSGTDDTYYKRLLDGGLPPYDPQMSPTATQTGPIAWAVSGVEMALCDLAGKALGFHRETLADGVTSLQRGFEPDALRTLCLGAGIENAEVASLPFARVVAWWVTEGVSRKS